MREGLVAEYRFEGNAADTSGAGRHGVVHGATFAADRFGRPGHALQCNGVDQYIEVAPAPSFGAEAMSLSVWVQAEPRDLRGWSDCIVAQDDGNDEDQSRRVFQLSVRRGHIVWHRMIGARDPMCLRRVRPGRWCHLVAVHEHGIHRLWLDGVLQDEVAHRFWVHPEQPMHIGRKGTGEPYFFFKGAIDDLRLHDRALSPGEIEELLHEGGWKPQPWPELPFPGDPLTGHWGEDGVVFLDLALDSSGGVTGRIMGGRPSNMALIADGHFDRSSGALRLEGTARDPRDGSHVVWNISGLLDEGEISVVARFNDFQGNFHLTRAGTRPRLTARSLRSHLGAVAWRVRKRFFRRSV